MDAAVMPGAGAERAGPGEHLAYLFQRYLDALLREDVGGCTTRGVLREEGPEGLPVAAGGARWLEVEVEGEVDRVWLPVRPAAHMQRWQSVPGLPAAAEREGRRYVTRDPAELVRWLLPARSAEEQACQRELQEELHTALEHRAWCEQERQRLFLAGRAAPVGPRTPAAWWVHLLESDRLASFLDHPYYPTARAKVGFTREDLARFAPEAQPRFLLRWVALPREVLREHGGARPPWWPRMEDVGLPPTLASSHALLPVHPHTWPALREEPALAPYTALAREAPRACVEVTPTLSVRTVVVLAAPHWHVKLPLRIRTLGLRNVRTMKASTLTDGHLVQQLLGSIVASEPTLADRVLLTDESVGAAVVDQPLLGFLARRYPEDLQDEVLLSVASLAAEGPDGRVGLQRVADAFCGGDVAQLFGAYARLTLELHLRLWVRYGLALESNQQNTLLVLSPRGHRLRLLLKDNDAPRLWAERLRRHPGLAHAPDRVQDRRILCQGEDDLARMFLTITLQLNLSALIEAAAARGLMDRAAAYAQVRAQVEEVLGRLEREGEETQAARHWLLAAERHPVKYLLTAATLRPRAATGAADVNKFYGLTGPNPLR